MAVTITKSKIAAKAKQTVSVLTETAQLYAEKRLQLDAKLAKLAALTDLVKELETSMLSMADMLLKDDEGDEIKAGPYVIKIGAKGKQAVEMDKEFIKQELGDELFEQLATFNVGDLKQYLTGDAMESAVTYQHKAKRKVTVKKLEA